MSHKQTSRVSLTTGKPLPRLIGPVTTVGKLKKALKNWPDSMPLSSPGFNVVTYNVGYASEHVAIEDASLEL